MIETAAHIALVILLVAFIIALIRLLIGPSLPDKVISLDLMFLLTMGIIITFIFISNKIVYLDIILIAALIIFLGTITIAKYLKETQAKK